MNRLVSGLIVYGEDGSESILMKLAGVCEKCREKDADATLIRTELFGIVRELLELATDYGFDKNLWQNYLTFLLITKETPFAITCEKTGAAKGSVNHFVMNDMQIFYDLFHYDFTELEEFLGTDCFDILTNYISVKKPESRYNKNVSEKVRELSEELGKGSGAKYFYDSLTGFYKKYGVGMFGLNKAFRIKEGESGISIIPVPNMQTARLDELVGYEIQKQKLIENTKAFVEGKPANNVLLFGDSGTGKSTAVRAIVNEFYLDGLRMVEIYKHQFKELSNVIAALKNRNYRFIIYMDDLSFEEFEIEYKFLKAVIEGGVETRPDNVLIYATSNRRHLIKEMWSDRDDVEQKAGMHKSDTMEEKLSLVNRFGVTISFSKPSQKEYFNIVDDLAARAGIDMPAEELHLLANKWELSHGGLSGRCAKQFIDNLAGRS